MTIERRKFLKKFYLVSIIALFVFMVAAICIGRYTIAPLDVLNSLFNPTSISDPTVPVVVQEVRIPRVLLAVVVGAGIAVAGASLQAIFGNPLVSEEILGVSSGASFGAALGIVTIGTTLGTQTSAVFFGFAAMYLTYIIARRRGRVTVLMLVLAGIITSSVFGSGVSLLKYFADPRNELPAITFWLMGSLASASKETIFRTMPSIIISLFFLYRYRWQLNLLSLEEDEAVSLGVNIKKMRVIIIFFTTVIVAAAVSIAGVISFVGLIVPHFTRMIVGTDNKHLIPATMIMGAIFVLITDTLARSLTGSEIPLSILSSLLGVPFFIYLLRRTGGVLDD
ncbi:iron ABC transporter permease [Paenibacillus sp. OV219]|uniref:FecCD family ABC transporter permease n=1 Tax=Paenibacillus sp. OV219 TaxID=1884377 RepID=UPI0008B2A4C4|nr:iron ABC transporter permease [Paenibacillus sp. OV219]SEN28533.1 iron complex transport system permease protein [Paenibacillus sp. OV219]